MILNNNINNIFIKLNINCPIIIFIKAKYLQTELFLNFFILMINFLNTWCYGYSKWNIYFIYITIFFVTNNVMKFVFKLIEFNNAFEFA